MPHSFIIAVSGGIGSGKSVISRIVTTLGFPVYDCDSNAKRLMDNNAGLKRRISAEICSDCVASDGTIDRGKLAEVVFSDSAALDRLNAIVHSSVRDDISQWTSLQTSNIVFVESAIVYQSGLDNMVDAIWEVWAPTEIRVQRIKARNGWSEEHIRQRIDSQLNFQVDRPHHHTYRIINDNVTPVLPQILSLLQQFKLVTVSPCCKS